MRLPLAVTSQDNTLTGSHQCTVQVADCRHTNKHMCVIASVYGKMRSRPRSSEPARPWRPSSQCIRHKHNGKRVWNRPPTHSLKYGWDDNWPTRYWMCAFFFGQYLLLLNKLPEVQSLSCHFSLFQARKKLDDPFLLGYSLFPVYPAVIRIPEASMPWKFPCPFYRSSLCHFLYYIFWRLRQVRTPGRRIYGVRLNGLPVWRRVWSVGVWRRKSTKHRSGKMVVTGQEQGGKHQRQGVVGSRWKSRHHWWRRKVDKGILLDSK